MVRRVRPSWMPLHLVSGSSSGVNDDGASAERNEGAELLRDPEMVAAIVNRAHRRLAGAEAAELEWQPRQAARQQIAH